MFALVRKLTGQPLAAVVSAVIFTASPLRTDHFPDRAAPADLPDAVGPAADTQNRGRRARPEASRPARAHGRGAVRVLRHHTVYFVTVLPALTLLLLMFSRQAGRRSLAQLAIAALVASAVIAVFLPAYLRNRDVVGERAPRELVAGSAELRDYRRAHPQNLVHGRRDSIGPAHRRLFPGFTTLGLAAAGLAAPVALAGPYVVALAAAVDSSLGVNGHLYPWFYAYLLPYRGLRVPARFGMLAAMFVSVLAGLGVASVMTRVRSAHLRYAFVAIATVMVIAESLNRPFVLRTLPPNIPAVYEWLRAAPPGVVVDTRLAGWRDASGPRIRRTCITRPLTGSRC